MEKRVSVVKETLPGEQRVVLLPCHVDHFVQAGFTVYVETGAGYHMEFADADYERVGARIVSKDEAWFSSRFVIKYKAPTPDEFCYFHPNLHLGAFHHAEGNAALTQALCRCGVTAYSYELFRTPDGIFPLSMASSEIAGKMAVIYGAYHLQRHLGGAGVLLAGVPGLKPPKVVVIGYGNAGGAAIRLASALGAEVVVFGTNPVHLRRFQSTVPHTVACYLNTPELLAQELQEADLVIGALLISTYDTPPTIEERHLKTMKRGAVIVDITCGYGPGYLPPCDQFTTFDEPVMEKYGVLYCKIKTLPAAVPKTTNMAVSNLLTPYLIKLGNAIFDPSLCDPLSEAGKIVCDGKIVHSEVERQMCLIPTEVSEHEDHHQ